MSNDGQLFRLQEMPQPQDCSILAGHAVANWGHIRACCCRRSWGARDTFCASQLQRNLDVDCPYEKCAPVVESKHEIAK